MAMRCLRPPLRQSSLAARRAKAMAATAESLMGDPAVHMSSAAAGSPGRPPLVVAIDGPAGAGKGTLARRLARELGLAYLDTGLMFRAVGWQACLQGVDLGDEARLEQLSLGLTPEQLALSELRSDQAAQAASRVSSLPRVRAALLQSQRAFALRPPGGAPGAVLDGRDIGTTVCPDAPVKLYVTADVDVRARRRVADLQQRGIPADYERVRAEMVERDARDSQRAAAPLRPADDAVLLDTSALGVEEVLRVALRHVEAATAPSGAA